MNEQEILEYNKKCALFLGYKYFPHPERDPGWRKEKGVLKMQDYYLARTTKDLKFDRDWNLIHRIIDAIEELGFIIKTEENFCLIQSNDGKYSETSKYLTNCSYEVFQNGITRKNAVIKAINNFLNWYDKSRNTRVQ